MVLVLFPTLRPSSYCEWVFHLSMLWVYSLQGIHRKLVALPKSLTVSVSMNTFMQSIHLRMISNGNACSTKKKKKAIKQRNHLYNFRIYISFPLPPHLLILVFFSFSAYMILCNYFKPSLWFCSAYYHLVLPILLDNNYVHLASWPLPS